MPSSGTTVISSVWLFRGLLGLLAVLLLARLSLLTAGGALSFPDEDRYLESIKAAQLLLAGQWAPAALHVANTQGRPADALLRLPVAVVQVLWYQLGGPAPEAPPSLVLPQLMNYAVLLGNLLLLYQLGRRWLPKASAVLSCLLYSALVNTNLYVRHVLPYDMALLVLLAALVLLTRPGRPVSMRHLSFLTGLLGVLVVAVYPGYYFAPLLLGAVLLARVPRQRWREAVLWAAVGAFVLLLPLELITRYGHISYLRTLQTLAPTITQGDFSEGVTFSGNYLWQVEGPLGLALGMLALPGLWSLNRIRAAENTAAIRAVGWGSSGLWLLHAALVYFAHQFVFYGRILHFFLPFLVLYAVSALAMLPATTRRISLIALLGVAVFGFSGFFLTYASLAYPRDVLIRLSPQSTDTLSYQNESGIGHALDFRLPPSTIRPQQVVATSYYLINFTYPYPLPVTSCQARLAPPQARLVFQGPHFLTFPAYGFEGFIPAERQHLRFCSFQCRVYKRGE
ncbi:hypothetical protein HMJ29_00060 [Hymenobacter taeanensis]|uniref:Glycosyltransferase RgtA/B/C/D-like domain-containing protein n=1 Tax=Hymenobacter taeanensis TaxID=2735321 RepID=A0A6M6BBR1_9BACT|nr:hypothetical protein [Hymenobacter taeanensis]QJX45412.1 hypothetical protein HMJ29_00060 [Hymenobacter taeanensis]